MTSQTGARASRSTRGGVFLKWAGGKGRLIAKLDPIFPTEVGAYHEPFLGAGAVFFHLADGRRIESAQLTDLNQDLIATFTAVRDHTDELVAELHKMRDTVDEDSYYRARDRFNRRRLGPVRQAAHLIYLNRTCYNGLYRVNSKGQFNVPYGRYKAPRILREEVLRQASAHLARAELRAGDFTQVRDLAEPGDLVYFDPPYDPLTATASFTGYAGAFGPDDQRRLAALFRELDERGVFVVLSNHATSLIEELYADYRIQRVELTRAINSKASRRSHRVQEVIVLGHAVPVKLR